MLRVLKWLALGAGGLLALVVLYVAVTTGPVLYRVYVGLNRYETTPPRLPAELKDTAVLIFSKTNGFRDDAAVAAANKALAGLARARGWSAVTTENGAVFNPRDLARFDAVVWNNTSGDVLTAEQKQAFIDYLNRGGGFVGVHGAGGDPIYRWRWYVESLIGAQFKGHTSKPHIQPAIINVEDRVHPATRGLPPRWTRYDEWYSFEKSPRLNGAHVLASLDESTYGATKRLAMGDHPLIWTRCIGKGRAIYSALGHSAETYEEPLHLQMLAGAIAWAAGLEGPACPPAK